MVEVFTEDPIADSLNKFSAEMATMKLLIRAGKAEIQALRALTDSPDGLACSLSPARRRVAKMVALGLTNRAIAQELGISVSTVKGTLRRVYDRLGVGNRVELTNLVHGYEVERLADTDGSVG